MSLKEGTYRSLSDENRVVMRHDIALNIDSFKAATDDFIARPDQDFPPLADATRPFMSVIIPNYNGERFLSQLLDALAKQTFGDFETIVIDDASTDDSVTLVERDFPTVRLIVNRRNQGFVANCNTAVDAADGHIVVLLNNDTEPEPTWLAALARTFCANPQAAAVTSKMLLFDERDKLHTTGDLLGHDGLPQNRGVWEADDGQYDEQTEVFSGCGAGTAYRRDVWQALGGFDEDFWMYLEDVDLGFRARLMGWHTVLAPDARIYHHLSASGGDTLSSYYVGRNTIWMLAKNMPDALLSDNFASIASAQINIAVDALRNWRGEAARNRLLGQIVGLLYLPRQLAKRRAIQANRRASDDEIRRLLIEAGSRG
jgi:GT2 family glycosyltransferase